MAEPAAQHIVEHRLERPRDEQEGWRARSAVEIFIAASERQVAAVSGDVKRHRPSAVRQVPQRQGAGLMRRGVERRHVVPRGALIVDMGQEQHRDLTVERLRDLGPGDGLHPQSRHQPGKAVRGIEVGREIAFLGQQDRPARTRTHCRGEQLEQGDRGRIGDQQLVRGGADDRREPGRDPPRRAHPIMLVPAGDEVSAPLHLSDLRKALGRRRGEGAQGIAVEVDDARRKAKPLAGEGQRIGGVERAGFVARHSLGRVTPLCPIYLPARSL